MVHPLSDSITDLIHTNVPSSQTNPASLPPINWSTKPNRNVHIDVPSYQINPTSPPPIDWSTEPNRKQQDAGTLDGSQGPFIDMPLADSVMDGSGKRRQLALLMRHLGHSVGKVNATSQQDGANPRGFPSSNAVHNSMHELEAALQQLESKHGLYTWDNEISDFLYLTAAVSHLSTLDAPMALEPHAPPGSPSYLFTSPLTNRKYYVILKGICTGIYYGQWYVSLFKSSSARSMISSSPRDDVRCLVDHVPGAVHKSFKTLEPATAFYLHAKKEGNVHYIRNPGDAVRYGPDEDAVQ